MSSTYLVEVPTERVRALDQVYVETASMIAVQVLRDLIAHVRLEAPDLRNNLLQHDL